MITTFVVMVCLALLCAWVAERRRRSRPRQVATSLRQQLLKRVYGDREMVERLLALERQRDPRMSEREVLREALTRLQRDRR